MFINKLYHILGQHANIFYPDVYKMKEYQSLRTIPWKHQGDEITTLWTWDTEHFVITITGNVSSVYFRIHDRASDQMFFDGQSATFEQAEMVIRETIGKAYHPSLGYRAYAGALATTFMLATGDKKDLSRYIGRAVEVEVLNANGSKENYQGVAQIVNYYLELLTQKIHIKVLPSHLLDIRPLVEMKAIDSEYERISGRTFKGKYEKGCTGTPGFMENTLDHSGLTCPIHEYKTR
jgi:hypothetical protein